MDTIITEVMTYLSEKCSHLIQILFPLVDIGLTLYAIVEIGFKVQIQIDAKPENYEVMTNWKGRSFVGLKDDDYDFDNNCQNFYQEYIMLKDLIIRYHTYQKVLAIIWMVFLSLFITIEIIKYVRMIFGYSNTRYSLIYLQNFQLIFTLLQCRMTFAITSLKYSKFCVSKESPEDLIYLLSQVDGFGYFLLVIPILGTLVCWKKKKSPHRCLWLFLGRTIMLYISIKFSDKYKNMNKCLRFIKQFIFFVIKGNMIFWYFFVILEPINKLPSLSIQVSWYLRSILELIKVESEYLAAKKQEKLAKEKLALEERNKQEKLRVNKVPQQQNQKIVPAQQLESAIIVEKTIAVAKITNAETNEVKFVAASAIRTYQV